MRHYPILSRSAPRNNTVSYRPSAEPISPFCEPLRSNDWQRRARSRVSSVAIGPAQATRPTGVGPLMIRCADRAAECKQAIVIIEGLLHGRLGNHRLAMPPQPSDIGIIFPSVPKENEQLFTEFRSGLTAGEIPWVWLSDRDHRDARTRISEPGIKIQNLRHSKGLRYRAVNFLWADQLPKPGWQHMTQDEQRMLFYIALTRAEDFLAITGSGASAFFDLLISNQ